MLGVPFHIDERAIVPRSYLGEILADDLFETLIPEPDNVRRVLDLCTGSGCLAVLAAMRFPQARRRCRGPFGGCAGSGRTERRRTWDGGVACGSLRGDLFAPRRRCPLRSDHRQPALCGCGGHGGPAARMPARAGDGVRWRRRRARSRRGASWHRPARISARRRRIAVRGRPLRSGAGGGLSAAAVPVARHRGFDPARCSGWTPPRCPRHDPEKCTAVFGRRSCSWNTHDPDAYDPRKCAAVSRHDHTPRNVPRFRTGPCSNKKAQGFPLAPLQKSARHAF